MGFFNDFIRGATPAIAGGTDIGLRGMAEAQRRKEEAEIQRRNAEQQAFMNLMRQQEMERQQQQDTQAQQNWNQTRQDNVYNNQQDDVYRDTQFRMGLEDKLKQNQFEQQRLDLSKQIGQAQIQNYQEPNNKYSAGVGGGQTQQGGFDPETAAKLAQQDAYKMAQAVDEYGDPTGQVDPAKFDQIVRQRYQFYSTFNPNQQQQLPQGSAELLQNVFNGSGNPQNQPQRLVGGQPQPMPQKQLHPALQKMVQDGLTKQDILNDYMQNAKEYEANGITLDMIGALAQ